jgi:ribosome-associated toxin RatA of RatAB toxin-antitoxin module
MADQGTSSIKINAGKAAIMAVIADFAAYPEWAGFIKRTEVLEEGADGRATQVQFVLDAGVLKDEYTLSYDWHDDDQVTWQLVSGRMMKSQRGSYTLVDDTDGTEVTYHLEVDLNMPMIGMFKRKAEKVIMDTALKELKRRVEGPA